MRRHREGPPATLRCTPGNQGGRVMAAPRKCEAPSVCALHRPAAAAWAQRRAKRRAKPGEATRVAKRGCGAAGRGDAAGGGRPHVLTTLSATSVRLGRGDGDRGRVVLQPRAHPVARTRRERSGRAAILRLPFEVADVDREQASRVETAPDQREPGGTASHDPGRPGERRQREQLAVHDRRDDHRRRGRRGDDGRRARRAASRPPGPSWVVPGHPPVRHPARPGRAAGRVPAGVRVTTCRRVRRALRRPATHPAVRGR